MTLETKKTLRGFALRFTCFSIILAITFLLLGQLFRSCISVRGEVPTIHGEAILPRVVLDPGHGGMDGGTSNGTLLEKDLNLQICLILRDLLRSAGIEVIMTRETDCMAGEEDGAGSRKMRDLRARLEIAETYPETLFVSVHMNYFPQASCSGMQIYYSVNDPGGAQIAETIRSMNASLLEPDNKRACKAADSHIFILDRIQNPAVLVECGFLSNPHEAAELADPAYQHALACVLCGAIQDFVSGLPPHIT